MKKITVKIIFVSLFTGILVALITGTASLYSLLRLSDNSIKKLEEKMFAGYDNTIQQQVDIAISLVRENYEKAKSGKMTDADARKKSIEELRKISFGNDGYFWINDMQKPYPMMIMHPTAPELEGTILNDPKFNVASGTQKNLFSEFVSICEQNGSGFVDYLWPKPGKTEVQPKKSYGKLFPEWNWVIGTGNYVDDIVDAVNIEKEKAAEFRAYVVLVMIICIILSLAVAFVFSIIMGKRISNPIIRLVSIVNNVAAGNLTNKIDIKAKDEVGILAAGINKMQTKLREIVTEIRQAASTISLGSNQISMSSQQIAQGANEQASSSEEVSASMEEMVSTINQNTENAQRTEQIAVNASVNIEKVAQAANQSLESVREITDKISVIGDIAEKTDLLAINAAVEAARAGKHGKGFAVVAMEVRKLAELTQKAAKEIFDYSKQSLSVTEEAGRLMSKVAPEIKQNAELVREISNSGMEQNQGAEQINSAIQQLSEVTQQNSASAEELATGAEELASQAENLNSIISYFKIESSEVNSVGRIFEMIEKHNIEIGKLRGQLNQFDNATNEAKPKIQTEKTYMSNKNISEGINLKLDADDPDYVNY